MTGDPLKNRISLVALMTFPAPTPYPQENNLGKLAFLRYDVTHGKA